MLHGKVPQTDFEREERVEKYADDITDDRLNAPIIDDPKNDDLDIKTGTSTFEILVQTIKRGQEIDGEIIEKLKRLSISYEPYDLSSSQSDAESLDEVAKCRYEEASEVGKKILEYFNTNRKQIDVTGNLKTAKSEINVGEGDPETISSRHKNLTSFRPIKPHVRYSPSLEMDGEEERFKESTSYSCYGRAPDKSEMIKLNDGFLQPPPFNGSPEEDPRAGWNIRIIGSDTRTFGKGN